MDSDTKISDRKNSIAVSTGETIAMNEEALTHAQPHRKPDKKLPQYAAAIAANISAWLVGTCLGWTSPIRGMLEDETMAPLYKKITVTEMSWVGSLLALGALITPFAAGPCADRFGRKWTLLGSTSLFVLAYILLLTTTTVAQIMVARLVMGFGLGFVMTVCPMYVGEISNDENRGALGSMMQLSIVSGILYVYCVGPYVSYYATQYICMALAAVFVACFFFMPDSPHYYISKNRKTDAINSLKFLRGKNDEEIQEELESIQTSVEECMQNKGTMLDVFKERVYIKALIISCGLISFQQLSGINVVLFYSATIFKKAGSDLDASVAAILVGAVEVLSSGSTLYLAGKMGRKTILMISAGGMSVSLVVLGVYFILSSIDSPAVPSIGWLPVVALILFVIVYCIGFGPLPWCVMGEMFPSNIKSAASSIVTSVCWIFGFLVTQFFSSIEEAIGTHWAFWIFAIFCACAFAFTMFVVMETKGLSLQEIQKRLGGKY